MKEMIFKLPKGLIVMEIVVFTLYPIAIAIIMLLDESMRIPYLYVLFALVYLILGGMAIWACSQQYVIKDGYLIYKYRNVLLMRSEKSIAIRDIARMDMTVMALNIYDKYDVLIMKINANNYITPRLYGELCRLTGLPMSQTE